MSQAEPPEVAIFEAALQLRAEERAPYLEKACAGDIELQRRVELLLGASERAGAFLKEPAVSTPEGTVRFSPPPTEKPGDRIGRYKLLEQIGEGGCGVVYVAEQEEPVRRRVALKVVKLGMDTKQVIARFDAERQALAMMDHPNIAKIFDAGITDTPLPTSGHPLPVGRGEGRGEGSASLETRHSALSTSPGRPYFVMELVRGIKITDYCDQNHLPPRERLDLFIQVCRAIQHAHQKGVIHRDIKPSNILVASNDGVAVPKVIDFGIAKATQGRLTDQTVYTAFEQFIGTPAYMSPEQAQISMLDIDTRTDIYSLGVLLYELLTGTTPFDAKELLAAGLDEMRRTIREVEPVKPSTRLTQELNSKSEIRNPKSEIKSAIGNRQSAIPSDLDWIVMKCLEKDRTRRYETANGLATDISRHLKNEPVVACPPSRLYRFQKTVQRNKLAFAAASAVVAALVIGLTVSTVMFVKETQARQRAVGAERQQILLRQEADLEKKRAQTAAARSEQVAQFLKEMLKSAGPQTARGRDTAMLREILARTAQRVEKDLSGQPEVQGEIWMTLGNTYSDIGEMLQAISMYQHAVDSYRLNAGDRDSNLARALGRLGSRQSFTGDTSAGKTNTLLGLQMARKSGDPETLATCLFEVSRSFSAYGTGSSQGIPYVREALAIRRQLGTNSVALSACIAWLAGLLEPSDEAESLYKEALALERLSLGPDHPNIASSLFGLGQVLLKRGKVDEAEPVLREAAELYRKVHLPSHPYQPLVFRFFAQALVLQGKGTEAETIVRHEAEAWATNAGYWNLLAAVNATRGEWAKSVEPLSRAVELAPDDYLHWPSLAIVLLQNGRHEDYGRHCHACLDHFPGLVAARVALLGPVDGADFDRACQMADVPILEKDGKLTDAWAGVTKSLAELRRGRFDSAIEWANCVLHHTAGECVCTRPSEAAAWFIQASAYASLQQMEAARVAFAKGQERLSQPGKVDLLWVWGDWIFAEYLGREAKALLDAPPATATEKKPEPR